MGSGLGIWSRRCVYWFALVAGLSVAHGATPVDSPDSPSILQKAQSELATASGNSTVLTPATVAIREDIRAREENTSRWTLGAFAQRFVPGGEGSRRGGTETSLQDLRTSTMFRIEGRWHLEPVSGFLGAWHPQILVHGSYSSQDVEVKTITGFRYQDTRLSTLLTATGLRMGLRPQGLPRVELAAGLTIGQALNFQTSRSDSATFSHNEWFRAGSLAVQAFLGGQWSLEAQYENRASLASLSRVRVQDHNFLVGFNWGRGP